MNGEGVSAAETNPKMPSEHLPLRPLWLCRACGQPWPCGQAKLALLPSYQNSRLNLLLYLSGRLHEAIDDLHRLNPRTTCRDIGTIATTGQPAIAGRFHTLVLQPTSFCNLDCSYCYLPDRRSRQLMSVPVATACARSIEQQASVLFDNCRFDYATLNRVSAAGSVAFTDCALVHGTWSSCRLAGVTFQSCDLSDLELDSCRLDGADLRGSRLHASAAPLDTNSHSKTARRWVAAVRRRGNRSSTAARGWQPRAGGRCLSLHQPTTASSGEDVVVGLVVPLG